MEKPILALALFLLASAWALATSFDVSAIFNFGDSICDACNNHFNKNCTAQADFPPYGSSFFHRPTGRFTNGRTVADFISEFMGIDLQKPYLGAQLDVMNGTSIQYPSNGINFASAGSGVLRETNQQWDRLQQFKTLVEQNQRDKDLIQKSLFFFESGSNDIYGYFLPFEPPTLIPDAFVDAMLAEVTKVMHQVYRLGGHRIVVFSLGPVGCVPARALLPGAPTDKCYGKMNVMVKKYNLGLENIVNGIPVNYPGATAVFGAVYDIVQRFRAIPTRYGMCGMRAVETTLGGLVQCGGVGYKVCDKPNQFLFWDYFHPTDHTYNLISRALWGGNKYQIRPLNLKTLASTTLAFSYN